MTIIVFGSINIDLVAKTPRLPVAGETVLGDDFFKAPGGKGANQAVASARLGVPTQMWGRVGAQGFGAELISHLQACGVGTQNVIVDETVSSGVAIIAVDRAGENQIIVIPGANGRVNWSSYTPQESQGDRSHLFSVATALLLQLEIPISEVIAAAESAHLAGVTVILDPAPATANLPKKLYSLVDIITPNEIEAGQLVGFRVDGLDSAKQAAQVLLLKGVKCAIVKLGAKGVFCATTDESFFIPAFSVQTVDTTAAGDAFNGALAAALTQGHTLRQAVTWGAAAGALATTKPGAQPSLPDKVTFDKFLIERGVDPAPRG